LFVDSSSEEEVGQPTKLSQFLNPPSPAQAPAQEKTNQPSSRNARNEAKSVNERDMRHSRQDARNERASDREYAQTQQRLLALAEYNDQPTNERDSHDKSRHTEHTSSHRSKVKNSRSPGHRRH